MPPFRINRAAATKAVIAVSLVVAAAGFTVAAQASRGAPHSRAKSLHRKAAPAQTATATATATGYAVLDRAPTAADVANGVIQGASRHDSALVPADARVLTDDATGKVWLVPSNDGRLCLAVQPAGQYAAFETAHHLGSVALATTCASDNAAASHGLALRLYNEVIGIAPDGVSTVSVALGTSAPVAVAVSTNVYRVSAPNRSPGSATFEDAGQPVVTPLP